MAATSSSAVRYGRFLLFIAGVGGLLYGIDVGIIAAALLYLSKTIDLSVAETSAVVAAVLGGSMVSSVAAGALADVFGRKKMMILSGLAFVASVGIIVLSQNFAPLFCGRLLQGMSGGVIAVVAPLYLAESLGADRRGRGTAIFQFMLTLGIALAALAGWWYTRQAETAMAFAAGRPAAIRAIENHAWRAMFFAVIYPGVVFFLGSFALSESPRWLFRRGRIEEARAALLRSSSAEEAEREMQEMVLLGRRSEAPGDGARGRGKDRLWRRKYAVPFLLACAILSLNQATGINSILGYLVVILRQAGLGARGATAGDVAVKVLNCAMTVVAIALVDRKGRKFLLRLGTGGVVIALLAGGLLFRGVEGKRIDLRQQLEATVQRGPGGETLVLPADRAALESLIHQAQAEARGQSPKVSGRLAELAKPSGPPLALTVLYSYGQGEKMASVSSSATQPAPRIEPQPQESGSRLVIERALCGPAPRAGTGWLIAASLAAFIAFFALGPGVVVWLALSELMPTRIRSVGMGIALLLNQGVSTLIAALFLPIAGRHGYAAIFFFWAACAVVYFMVASFWLPETKGKTLEEIERYFEGGAASMAMKGAAGR